MSRMEAKVRSNTRDPLGGRIGVDLANLISINGRAQDPASGLSHAGAFPFRLTCLTLTSGAWVGAMAASAFDQTGPDVTVSE